MRISMLFLAALSVVPAAAMAESAFDRNFTGDTMRFVVPGDPKSGLLPRIQASLIEPLQLGQHVSRSRQGRRRIIGSGDGRRSAPRRLPGQATPHDRNTARRSRRAPSSAARRRRRAARRPRRGAVRDSRAAGP